MKLIARVIAVLLLACFIFALAGVAATWAPDRSVQVLMERWAQAPSQFVEIDNMQIHLRDEGPRDDPVPIVLLHGTSASLHTWDGWARHLSPHHRVIRFDLPAFGLTGPHPKSDYSIAAYVKTVGLVADKLGIDTFVLVGNSLGGQIAWETALAMPKRVSKLVLVDSAGYAMQSTALPIGFRIAQTPGLRVLMEHVLPRGVVESSLRNVYGDPSKVTSELIDRYYDLALRAGNRQALALRLNQPLSGEEEKIKSISSPTLILWGAKDHLIPIENAYRFNRDINHSRLVVFDDLGHAPHEENAKKSVEAFSVFLASK